MKRFVFLSVLGLLSMALFAQKWTIDGNINFFFANWETSNSSGDSSELSLNVKAGYYITDVMNVGLRAGFSYYKDNDGRTSITIGPYLKYDLFKFEKVYFAVTGGVFYTRYNESYSWNTTYSRNDANRFLISIAPSFTYMISRNIEVYWEFARLNFSYDWLTLRGTNIDCSSTDFRLSGPFTNGVLGVIFRF